MQWQHSVPKEHVPPPRPLFLSPCSKCGTSEVKVPPTHHQNRSYANYTQTTVKRFITLKCFGTAQDWKTEFAHRNKHMANMREAPLHTTREGTRKWTQSADIVSYTRPSAPQTELQDTMDGTGFSVRVEVSAKYGQEYWAELGVSRICWWIFFFLLAVALLGL